jgi:hypothetical protein
VPDGAEVVAYVDGDRILEASKLVPETELATATPVTTAAPVLVPLTIAYPANVPPGTTQGSGKFNRIGAAIILVDGTFTANTPATSHLSPANTAFDSRLMITRNGRGTSPW